MNWGLVILAAISVFLIAIVSRSITTTAIAAMASVAALFAISSGLGYPTNLPFPDKATIYALTPDYVWAGTQENTTPRSYIFKAPPEWFEEHDKRQGQPFEVERIETGDEQETVVSNGDVRSEGDYMIHEQVLPKKDDE